MCKTWKLMKMIHNWLMKDCLPRLAHVLDVLDKVQNIINKLRYRQHELEQKFVRINEQTSNTLLETINKAGEMLDADTASSYVDSEDLEELNSEKGNDQSSATFNYLLSSNQTDSNRFHTLKKHVLACWNTILIMFRSYSSNISGIEILLQRLKCFDLILSPGENQMVNDLIEFLSTFESTTTILP